LGKTFDIHGGGPDLPFPHHENEIAQSEAANGCTYVNYWMHAGPVRMGQEKMSKSLGNFFTIREVLKHYNPEVVRYFLSSVHYRSYIDYSEDGLREAHSALERFYQALKAVPELAQEMTLQNDYEQRFVEAMDDDFNTPRALAVLFEIASELNKAARDNDPVAPQLAAQLKQLAGMIGLLQQEPDQFLQGEAGEGDLSAEEIEAFIEQRAQARKDKDFAESDRIRDLLAEKGVVLKDSRDGTSWYREG
jgi:cysteinyl-tRNA synthetase